MKSITNYQPGPRGINLKGGTTRWVEPGQTLEIDMDEVQGELPDFGKPADQGERDADELETLRARVADLEAELAAYRAGKGDGGRKPGLTGKTKPALLEIAKAEGVEVEDDATVEDIRSAIELHREG